MRKDLKERIILVKKALTKVAEEPLHPDDVAAYNKLNIYFSSVDELLRSILNSSSNDSEVENLTRAREQLNLSWKFVIAAKKSAPKTAKLKTADLDKALDVLENVLDRIIHDLMNDREDLKKEIDKDLSDVHAKDQLKLVNKNIMEIGKYKDLIEKGDPWHAAVLVLDNFKSRLDPEEKTTLSKIIDVLG